MGIDATQLILFTGQEGALMDQAKAAFARIAEFPEVITAIEEGNRLHGKKLTIKIVPSQDGCMYNDRPHCISVGQARVKHLDVNGNEFFPSTEVSLAHEIAHTKDVFDLDGLQWEIIRKRGDQVMFEACMEAFMNAAPAYKERMVATGRDEAKLRPVISEIYDKHLEISMLDALMHDPDIATYFERLERPAIDFGNLIAKKLGEPQRLSDYIESAKTLGRTYKERFIEDFFAGLQESQAESENTRIGGKDPSNLRSDIPPKSDEWRK